MTSLGDLIERFFALPTTDWLLPVLSISMIVLYHFYLIWEMNHHPENTLVGISNGIRKTWVRCIRQDKNEILAVQTMRNWTMSSTFLASTAVLMWMGSMHLIFSAYEEQGVCYAFMLLAGDNPLLWSIKWAVIMMDLFFVFVNFTLTVRFFNHSGIMIAVPPGADPHVTTTTIAERVNRGAFHHALGMHGYYITVPLILWLFSPWAFFFGSIALLYILKKIDHHIYPIVRNENLPGSLQPLDPNVGDDGEPK